MYVFSTLPTQKKIFVPILGPWVKPAIGWSQFWKDKIKRYRVTDFDDSIQQIFQASAEATSILNLFSFYIGFRIELDFQLLITKILFFHSSILNINCTSPCNISLTIKKNFDLF